MGKKKTLDAALKKTQPFTDIYRSAIRVELSPLAKPNISCISSVTCAVASCRELYLRSSGRPQTRSIQLGRCRRRSRARWRTCADTETQRSCTHPGLRRIWRERVHSQWEEVHRSTDSRFPDFYLVWHLKSSSSAPEEHSCSFNHTKGSLDN